MVVNIILIYNMKKTKKNLLINNFILENKIENTVEDNYEELNESKYYISEEKFSITWDQETNSCDNTKLTQSLEIKTENCNDNEYLVLSTEKWNFKNIEDLIYILSEFKKKYDMMKN